MADPCASGSVKTACPYCGVGCGVAALAGPERSLSVKGDPAHPANEGRLCSKGAALGATVGLEGRLLHPMIKGRRSSWERAVRTVADRFARTVARHGPDAVAFYVSGQLLTEDYYAANKLMKGFIGSGNIDTNSRLCMASAVAAHKQAFGADLVPGCYEDLELADLIVFAGHNAAWTHPVLYRRMEAARTRGERHVVIDPRRTDTADGAELHLPIAPQTDVRLWNGLLADLIRRGAIDRAYIAAHVNGFDAVEETLGEADQSPSAVAADCGIAEAYLLAFYDLFAATPRTVTLFSQGSNQSAQGVAKGLAVLNAHLATGRIGKPGACPFSITGQPNAMGGREVGGMSNTLAAHMEFDAHALDRLARFWSAPRLTERPGLKAVEMFEAIHDGRIKAVWIMATNPAVSLPNAGRVREALAKCEFVAVSDCMAGTDTLTFADVALPALAWGEKDGTVTNSERCISRQRALFAPPGEAKPDWRIIAEVASAMGHGEAFGWRRAADVFREWARLTAYENDRASSTARFLDLSGLSAITPSDYDALEPVQWPVREGASTPRLFTDGRFQFPDGRARMVPVQPKPPAIAVEPGFPLSLNTGRVRDQWHTMTRTGLAPALCRHAPEPYVEIHPCDAEPIGVTDGALTRVQTRLGEAVVRAAVTERQRRGSVFMPMHWTNAFAPSGRANPLVTGVADPISGQPEFKHTPARVSPYRETWSGFLMDRDAWSAPEAAELVWRRVPQDACQLHEFAGRGDEAERERVGRALSRDAEGERLVLEDAAVGSLRQAWIKHGRMERVLFTTVGGRLPPRAWIAALFLSEALSAQDRAGLLLGRAPGAVSVVGPLICACRNVSQTKIRAAVADGCLTLAAIGERTGAGVTCGSCRPEIARLIASEQPTPTRKDLAHAA